MKNNIIYDNNKLHLIALCVGNWNMYANDKYIYYNDSFKTKREKKRMNYYINKLNECERLLND